MISRIGLRASVFFPVRMLLSVSPSCSVEAVNQDQRRRAEIAQRLQGKIRCHTPARLEGLFRSLEGLGVTAAQAGVRPHGFLVIGALSGRCYAVAPASILRERWARQGFARSARR